MGSGIIDRLNTDESTRLSFGLGNMTSTASFLDEDMSVDDLHTAFGHDLAMSYSWRSEENKDRSPEAVPRNFILKTPSAELWGLS